ncbi:hypothetical protein BGZ50_001419 [Haplosporangium sp. Z 11]|nr:hypothetical protein BGZ50_001419 [Haplosporangium sp. Z 11]
MKSLAKSYDPQQGPAFGQLTREDISKVVKKDDVDVQDGAVKLSDGSLAATGNSASPSVVGPGAIQTVAENALTTDAVAPAAPSASSKPASWAELLRSKNQPSPSTPSTANSTPNLKSVEGNKASNVNGVKFDGIADVLYKFKPTYTSPLIQPRGLVNNGNMCFMNAIGKHVVHSFKSSTPLVDSLIMFLNEFHVSKKNQPDYGPPFVPEYVYDALRGLKRFDSMRGRQEDCQEFLGYLLDGLHEEFFAAMKEKPAGSEANGHLEHDDSESGVSEDEWMEVTGPKNKASYTRSTQFSETPISIIFSGQLRSILRIPTQKDSVTLEPFQSLQLDLTPDNVYTIEDALHNSTIPEVLDGFTSAEKGGIPVEATKKIFIEHVPPVLVLHLKRFIYKDGGTQKLHKQVGYKTVLNLQPDLISPTRRPASAIPYKLFGVVYHHGRTAAGGHYTCDILRQNAEWLHIDDTNITVISEADVTVDMNSSTNSLGSKQHMNGASVNDMANESTAFAAALSASSIAASKASDGVAYVLFYIRSDQKDSPVPPMSIASSPATPKGSSISRPTTNGAGQVRSGATTSNAWSVPKK